MQAYVLYLIRDRQRSWSTCNITVNALRFLYHTTLKRDRTTFCVPSPRTLPARKADLLPIPYFHVVFTLPHDLNALAQGNPRVIYALLFRAAADTLLTFGRDGRHRGGTIGITAILHTWGQTLTQHLHVHCLVTGGALAANGARWITGRSSFLFSVRALSTVFRAKYLAGLQRAYDAGQLAFAGGPAARAERRAFTGRLGQLRAVRWVVYAKRPFAGPEQVLEYLGRYTHRVALPNHRLVDHGDGRVRFRWKDYADHDRVKCVVGSPITADTGPAKTRVSAALRSRSRPPRLPAPHPDRTPLVWRHPVLRTRGPDQNVHRVTADPPYNPHKVCAAEPRGFVQQGLSARHARGCTPDQRGRADQTPIRWADLRR